MSTTNFERESTTEANVGSDCEVSSQGTLMNEDFYRSQPDLATNSGNEVGQISQDQDQRIRGDTYYAIPQEEGNARNSPTPADMRRRLSYDAIMTFQNGNPPFSHIAPARAPMAAEDSHPPDDFENSVDLSADEKPMVSNKRNKKGRVRRKSGDKTRPKEGDGKRGNRREKSSRDKRAGREGKRSQR